MRDASGQFKRRVLSTGRQPQREPFVPFETDGALGPETPEREIPEFHSTPRGGAVAALPEVVANGVQWKARSEAAEPSPLLPPDAPARNV